MLVRILRESSGPHPDFHPNLPHDPVTNPRVRTIPVGTEIEHPDAWLLCLPHGAFPGKDPLPAAAEPLDDEARAAVVKAQQRRARADKPAAVKFPDAAATPRPKPVKAESKP